MPYVDKNGNICGFLDIEEKDASNIFVRRFFMLDRRKGIFKYYMDNPQNLAPGSEAVNQFSLQYISIVGDAKRLKPKEPFAFYFTFAGKNVLLRADNSTDKEEWIQTLNEATKVVVGQPAASLECERPSPHQHQSTHNNEQHSQITDSGGSYQVEVFGDIILKTEFPVPATDKDSLQSSHSSSHSWNPYNNQSQVIKKGYAVKQGLVRKNWKRRFFVLTPITLSYFKDEEDKEPIKVITLADVVEARVSVGIHLNKEHVLEVVTGQRVFYMQTETAGERDSWIKAINHCIDQLRQPRHHCLYSKCLHDDHPQTKLCLNSEVGHDHFKMTSALNHKSNYTDSHHYTPEPCHCSEKVRSSILCIRL